ncbi:MAG: RimK family alpha-L-glutamate ligase [Anaeromyxobacteraceae bacterium]
MRIGIIAMRNEPGSRTLVMPSVVELLRQWGAHVDVIYPDEQSVRLRALQVEHDLYVLKSETDLALSMAGALDAAGAQILNPYAPATMMRDKLVAVRVLQSAGVPVPETHVTSTPRLLADLLEGGPLAVRSCRASRGNAVQVVWDAEDLDGLGDGPLLAQRYDRSDALDRKLYCIGGQLFGVLRRWPARTYEEKLGEAFTITPELHDLAMRCGAAFGVDLFGIDLITCDGRPSVVDVKSFPSFKGVPDAALRLADYVYSAASRVLAGEAPVSLTAIYGALRELRREPDEEARKRARATKDASAA